MNLPNIGPKNFLKTIYASAWGMPILFACLGLIGLLRQSMWRDEMNVWLIARDSQSWGELLSNLHYDRGHPPLWHLLVAGTKLFFDNPVAMQILHLIIAIGAVCILWRYSPFPRWVKTLFIFSYLPFYEFLLVARNYGIGMLLLFAACTVFPARERRYWPIAILLALAANTNLYAMMVAIAFSLTLIFELLIDKERRQLYWAQAKVYDGVLSLAIIVIGYYIAYSFITPPDDAVNATGEWFLYFDMRRFMRSAGRWFGSYFLIIPNSRKWLDLIVCDSILLIVIGLTLLKFLRKPIPLFFYTTASGLLLSFTYFKFLGRGLRHYGHFYLIWILALWLASYYRPTSNLLPIIWHQLAERWYKRAFVLVLCVQLLGGIGRYSVSLFQPYSASRAAARYIQQENLQDEFIVGHRDANMAALSGYLGRQLYYPQTRSLGSYTLFFKGDRTEVEKDEALRQTQQLLVNDPQLDKILLIMHRPLGDIPTPGLKITPITEFKRAQEISERYYLYWAEPG
ncbi:MAG: hypothetical protein AAGF01_07270 [Cyanobacteria bacterium P01_G01_bin.38]